MCIAPRRPVRRRRARAVETYETEKGADVRSGGRHVQYAGGGGTVRQALDRLLVGRTLVDRYRIDEMIGAGGMSVVYRGTDLVLARPVAVKVVSIDAGSPDARDRLRARFRREAGAAARIPPHPNVVQIHDFRTDEELGLDFIVMEMLEGRDLKQALAASPPSRAEALRILRETARGLAAGHRAGIVHRDVKPANVFLLGSDELEGVRVLDFGIAKPLDPDEEDELTRTGQVPHSPAYASPEQMVAHGVVTAASDVYSLGLIAYELLSGRRPWDDAQRARIRAGEQLALPDRGRWPAVPEALRAIVERALRTRPEERFADAAEMAEALSIVATATDAGAEPVTAVEHPEEPTKLALEHDAGPATPPADRRPRPEEPALEFAPVAQAATPAPEDEHPPHRPSPRLRMAAVIAPVALFVLLGIWLLGRRGGTHGVSASAARAVPDTGQLAALDDEFLRLEGSVAANQAIGAARPPSAPTAPAADTALDPAREQAVIQQNIVDVHDAFVKGDLPRLLSHYAGEVRYHSRETSSLAQVQSVVGQLLAKYPARTIIIKRQAITFPSSSKAKALVDRAWDYGGLADHWTGSDRLLLYFERQNGAWKITSERRLTTYRSRHKRI
jgi:hypothetical protein